MLDMFLMALFFFMASFLERFLCAWSASPLEFPRYCSLRNEGKLSIFLALSSSPLLPLLKTNKPQSKQADKDHTIDQPKISKASSAWKHLILLLGVSHLQAQAQFLIAPSCHFVLNPHTKPLSKSCVIEQYFHFL